VRDRDYELEQWRRLGDAGIASLWFAGWAGGTRARCFFRPAGGSSTSPRITRRSRPAPYSRQPPPAVEIIRWAAGAGFTEYDMGGVDTQSSPGVPEDESHPSGTCTCSSTASAASRRFAFGSRVRPKRAAGQAWRLASTSDERRQTAVDTSPPGGGTPENVESPRVHDWRPRNLIPPGWRYRGVPESDLRPARPTGPRRPQENSMASLPRRGRGGRRDPVRRAATSDLSATSSAVSAAGRSLLREWSWSPEWCCRGCSVGPVRRYSSRIRRKQQRLRRLQCRLPDPDTIFQLVARARSARLSFRSRPSSWPGGSRAGETTRGHHRQLMILALIPLVVSRGSPPRR